MKADSLSARIACAPALQSFYAKLRQIPLLGGLFHGIARSVLPSGTHVTTRVRQGRAAGLVLSLDPRYEAPYAAGLHETELLDCLAQHLKQGGVLYDVGGHIGLISMVGARLVGPSGSVFAFEADPENAARIFEHLRMNSLPQVELVNAAVWSECKTLSFERASATSSRNRGSVANGTDSPGVGELITVPAITLDSFAADHRPPAVIKVDVEGAEAEVLQGAAQLLRVAKPILICEIHHAQAEESVTGLLRAAAYRWSWLDGESRFPRHMVAQPTP